MFFSTELLTRRDGGFGLLWYVGSTVLTDKKKLTTAPPGWPPHSAQIHPSISCPSAACSMRISRSSACSSRNPRNHSHSVSPQISWSARLGMISIAVIASLKHSPISTLPVASVYRGTLPNFELTYFPTHPALSQARNIRSRCQHLLH